MRERAGREKGVLAWERERQEFFEGVGMELKEVEERRRRGEFRWKEV